MQTYGLQIDTTDVTLPFVPALQLLYINGAFAHEPARYGRGRVYIDVSGAAPTLAMWLDVEKGDATVDDIPAWLDNRSRAGLSVGGVYCNRATLPDAEAAAGRRPHLLGVATLDGTIDISPPPGIGVLAFVQAWPAAMLGTNWDISAVVDADYWKGHSLTV